MSVSLCPGSLKRHPSVGERLKISDFFELLLVRPAIAVAPGLPADPGSVTLEQYLGLPHRGRHGARRLRVALRAQSLSTIPHVVAQSDAIATVAVQLCGCVTNQAAINDMERRHAQTMVAMGGSGGGRM